MGIKLLFVGWDGADWEIIDKLVCEGKLPNVASLLKKSGTGYKLKVPIPPTTFSSWTTILTGTNPARHGITDFSEIVPQTYRIKFLTALDRTEPALWEYFDALGARTCVLGFPATYPPDEINGFFLSGFESPVAVSAKAKFAHPKEVYQKISLKLGHWLVGGIGEFRISSGWHARALRHAHTSAERKLNYAKELIKNYGPFDVIMIWFGEIDTVCHHFWRFYDDNSPRFDPNGAKEFKDAIPSIYYKLDYVLGVLIDEIAPENMILVSDHGFGGAGVEVFHLNAWLKENGYLKFKNHLDKGKVLKQVQKLALKYIPAQIQEMVFRANQKMAEKIESVVRFSDIDFPQTRAFSEELNYAPAVRLNVFGQKPDGIVKKSEASELLSEIAGKLEELKSLDGIRLIKRAWRREELYLGPHLERLPELIIQQAYPNGYSVNFLRSAPDSPVFRRLEPKEFAGVKGSGMNGTHRETGVFIISGIEKSRMVRKEMVDALDVAPTCLALFGRRSKRMEGKPVFESDRLFDVECERKLTKGDAYSEVAKRLKDAGYLS